MNVIVRVGIPIYNRMSRPNPKRYSLDVENYRSSRAGDKSALFHNALKKMDGVIGYG